MVLKRKTNTYTELMYAVESGDTDMLEELCCKKKYLLEKVFEGKTALMMAAQNGNMLCVTILCRYGANVDASTEEGKTALSYALENDNATCICILVEQYYAKHISVLRENGEKCEYPNHIYDCYKHESTLNYVARQGYYKCVQSLCQNKADVNAKDLDGKTALMNACEFGNKKCIRALCEYGANRYVKNNGKLFQMSSLFTTDEHGREMSICKYKCVNTSKVDLFIRYFDRNNVSIIYNYGTNSYDDSDNDTNDCAVQLNKYIMQKIYDYGMNWYNNTNNCTIQLNKYNMQKITNELLIVPMLRVFAIREMAKGPMKNAFSIYRVSKNVFDFL